jgi:hypothetical protein
MGGTVDWTFRTIYGTNSEMLDRSSGLPDKSPDAAIPLDLMSELLLGMRLRGIDYHRISVAPPFGLGFGTLPGRAQYHFITARPA